MDKNYDVMCQEIQKYLELNMKETLKFSRDLSNEVI